MSDLERLRDWMTKANAMASVVYEWRSKIAESRIKHLVAARDENPRAAERHKAEIVYSTRQLDHVLELLYEATYTDSVESASLALMDIKVAVQAAFECYEAWRKVAFLTDVMSVTGEGEEAEYSMEQAVNQGNQKFAEYTAALELANSLIPEDTELTRLPL